MKERIEELENEVRSLRAFRALSDEEFVEHATLRRVEAERDEARTRVAELEALLAGLNELAAARAVVEAARNASRNYEDGMHAFGLIDAAIRHYDTTRGGHE